MTDLDREMEMLKERGLDNPLPFPKMAKITAAALDRTATQWAFRIYHDKQFKKLAKLDNLEQTEQDRVFNELILGNIVLVMMTLESPDLRVENALKEYYLTVKDEVANAHDGALKELGIERKFRKDWRKLIQMRYKEYSQDKHKARKAAILLESKEKELNEKSLLDIQLMLPLQTVAIGTHFHICKQKKKGTENLFKRLVKLMGKFYVEIRVPLEGGKITRWRVLLVRIKRLLQKTIWHFP